MDGLQNTSVRFFFFFGVCVCVFTCSFSRAGIKDALMTLVIIGMPKLWINILGINRSRSKTPGADRHWFVQGEVGRSVFGHGISGFGE